MEGEGLAQGLSSVSVLVPGFEIPISRLEPAVKIQVSQSENLFQVF